MKKCKDLVAFGSFGFGNAGDEAIPYAMSDLLKQQSIPHNISIVSRYDSPSMENVIGLGEQYGAQLEKLNNQPVIISGGGVIEPKDISCILRYENYYEKMRPEKTSIIAGSFEFGVNYSWGMKRRLRKLFSQMEHIYTRDYFSESYFRDNFPEFGVSTLGDMALGMQANEQSSELLAPEGTAYIAVCLSGTWKNSASWLSWISHELLNISNHFKKTLVFVPMSCHDSDDDRVEHDRIIAALEKLGLSYKPTAIRERLGPREIAAIFRDSSFVIATRLHSCVMAYGQKTPFVGIAYHPKLIGFAQTVGWRPFLLPEKEMPNKQDAGKYGYEFSSLKLSKGDLFQKANDAIEYGEFNLLPLFVNNLKKALSAF